MVRRAAVSAAQQLASRMYDAPDVVQSYVRMEGLLPSEQRVVSAYPDAFRGQVLDVGVGAGRTTAVLAPGAAGYLGVDFSSAMIAEAQRANPTADLRVLDMRELPHLLAGRRFDAILLSYNTIDHISWPDRAALFVGLRGLLSPGGLLVFSTHSLDEGLSSGPLLDWARWATALRRLSERPLAEARALAASVLATAVATGNRIRHRRHESAGDGYAFVNDPAHGHATVICYVSERRQREALAEAGYAVLARIPQHEDRSSHWHYYVCREAA